MLLVHLFFIVVVLAETAVFIADKTINTRTCDEIVSLPHSGGGGSAMDKNRFLFISTTPGAETLDKLLFDVFSSHAAAYANQHLGLEYHQDSGYRRITYPEGTENFYIQDSPNATFGGILFLNDSVAGGSLSIGIAPHQITVVPECGRLVLFPVTYAFPKKLDKIKLGNLHFVFTYFS